MFYRSFHIVIVAVAFAFVFANSSFAAGNPDLDCIPDTVDFGTVIIGEASTHTFILTDTGGAPAYIDGVRWSNNVEFSVQGPSHYWLGVGDTITYRATFTPNAAGPQQSTVVITDSDMSGNLYSQSVLLTGEGHPSIVAHLSIAQNYLVYADSNIVISQVVTDSLNGSLSPIQSFQEDIQYNDNLLELIDIQNGARTPSPAWRLTKIITIAGSVHITGVSSTDTLHGPGEILRLIFYVLSDAPVFTTSAFTCSNVGLGINEPFEPVIMTDTGELRVIDTCVPLVGTGVTPASSVMQITQNPAIQSTSISYFISDRTAPPEHVQFRLYNAAGNLVRSVDHVSAAIGWHELPLDVSSLSSGVYSLAFQAGAAHEVQRLLILH